MRSWIACLPLLAACATRPAVVRTHESPEQVLRPLDTAEIARDLVGGRVGALFFVDRFQFHPGASKITRLGGWGSLLEGTEMDALSDVHRAYITAPSSHDRDRILVLEHTLPEGEVANVLKRIASKSAPKGTLRTDLGMPAVQAHVEDKTVVVAAPRPGLLVSVPADRAADVARFRSAGGLPEPLGKEAARFFAFDPDDTLENAPAIPTTISAAQAAIVFGPNGAVLSLEGVSATPAQASADAAKLTHDVEEAITVDLVLVRMYLLGPVRFRAEGSLVKTDVTLLAGEVEWLLAVATAAL